MSQLFDDEFMGPLVGALSSAGGLDPVDHMRPTMDVWQDKNWLLAGRRERSKDPLRRLIGSIDVNGRHIADDGTVLADPMDVVIGDFSLSNWESNFDNGYIPTSALATVKGTTFTMQPHAASAMSAMIAAAHAEGVNLTIGNTYRDYQTQATAHASDTTPETPTAPAGKSNHGWGLAVDFNITPENHAWLVANAGRFGYTNPFGNSYNATENWHWEFGQGGDAPNYTGGNNGGSVPARNGRRAKPRDLSLVPLKLSGGDPGTGLPSTYSGGLGMVMPDLLMPEKIPGTRRSFAGSNGSINKQLYKGFMDAGRPDLAKMVGTPAFTAWVNAESGYNPSATSPANNNGLANDGLFQFWRGHEWNASGQAAGWSPYRQAQAVVQYFDLSVEDIQRYAAAIKAGTYSGWG